MQIKHPSFHLSTSENYFPKATPSMYPPSIITTATPNQDSMALACHQDPLTPSNRGRWNHRWIVDCEIWSGPASNKIPDSTKPLKTFQNSCLFLWCNKSKRSKSETRHSPVLLTAMEQDPFTWEHQSLCRWNAVSVGFRLMVTQYITQRQHISHKVTSLILIIAGVRL